MALTKCPVSKYAQLEMNRAAYLKNGEVVSQLPLADDFTAAAPCENGMWVDADKANGEIKPISDDTLVFGIVYTTEKEFNDGNNGLKHFCQIGGDYPRVGIMHVGDTFTTNCFQYDTTEFTTEAALWTACNAAATTPVYVLPVEDDGRPQVTKTLGTAPAFYGKVIKAFTMPNGEKAIKYNIVVA